MTSEAPRELNRFGQSPWLDNFTRDLLDGDTLKHYIWFS